MWQVLGKEETFPLFCVLNMVIGVLSYILAVYQIFLGLEEDKVVTGSSEEAGLEMESTTMAQEDLTAGVSRLGQCSSNNTTVWPEVERKRQEKTRRENLHNLSCPTEVGTDPAEGSSARRVPGKVKSGSQLLAVSKIKVEIEIPGLILENSENKDLYAVNEKTKMKNGRVTYPGYSTRDTTPMPVGPEEAMREDDANLQEADSWKPQVMKNVQPTGETWQLNGDKWVEIKPNKKP